jgi:hypothetical protein
MTDELIKTIKKQITWLDNNAKSTNIQAISIVVNKLQILAQTLSEDVTQAYALMNETEDNYKAAIAKFVAEYDGGVAKAERLAEVEFVALKKQWTQAKNIYKGLDMLLDRLDKISDSQRQRVSVVKQSDLKNVDGIK